jgi:carboxylesterase
VSPLGPNRPLNFFAPVFVRLKPRWDMTPVFADPEYITYGNGYEWVPTKTWLNIFDFMKATEERLPEVTGPIMILHSRNDSSNSPEGAALLYDLISTPEDLKRLVWFEKSEHDMFNDCEWETVIQTIVDYVKERIQIK